MWDGLVEAASPGNFYDFSRKGGRRIFFYWPIMFQSYMVFILECVWTMALRWSLGEHDNKNGQTFSVLLEGDWRSSCLHTTPRGIQQPIHQLTCTNSPKNLAEHSDYKGWLSKKKILNRDQKKWSVLHLWSSSKRCLEGVRNGSDEAKCWHI